MIGERDLRLVTPEAVVLEFDTAGLPSRLLAKVLDLVIEAVVGFGGFFLGALVAGAAGSSPSRVVGITLFILATVFIFMLLLGYSAIFETLWKGRTPGKAALGLRVVTTEGAPIRFRHAAIRSALGLLDVFFLDGLIGVVTILATRNNQRLGDLVAGTIVVRERSGARAPTAIAFAVPPGCEPYAETLDVSAVSPGEYGAVRGFLLRAGGLSPHVRNGLATELATPLVQRMRHTPPAWVGPELFLACVAAVYQRRFGSAPVPAPAWSAPPVAPGAPTAGWGVARPTAPPAPDEGLPFVHLGPGLDPSDERRDPPRAGPSREPIAPTGFEAPG